MPDTWRLAEAGLSSLAHARGIAGRHECGGRPRRPPWHVSRAIESAHRLSGASRSKDNRGLHRCKPLSHLVLLTGIELVTY